MNLKKKLTGFYLIVLGKITTKKMIMKSIKQNIILLLLSIFLCNYSWNQQTLNGKYGGWWAETSWIFEFSPKGTFTRTSNGHYGFSVVNGKYYIKNDTLFIQEGHQNTHGTVSEHYLIENDSVIIDLVNKYDYHKLIDTGFVSYNSKWRSINYPYTQGSIKEIENVDSLFSTILKNERIKKYYTRPELKNKTIYFQPFHHLNLNLTLNDVSFKTLPKENIKTDLLTVNFSRVNVSLSSAEVDFSIPFEGVHFKIICYKIDDVWKVSDIQETEQ